MQNATIEERVTLLEIQVVVIQDDVTELDEDVTLLEGDVNFLFDEQVIQDERLLNLEETSFEVVLELEGIFFNQVSVVLMKNLKSLLMLWIVFIALLVAR